MEQPEQEVLQQKEPQAQVPEPLVEVIVAQVVNIKDLHLEPMDLETEGPLNPRMVVPHQEPAMAMATDNLPHHHQSHI
jgi:hypothetical protein